MPLNFTSELEFYLDFPLMWVLGCRYPHARLRVEIDTPEHCSAASITHWSGNLPLRILQISQQSVFEIDTNCG